MDHVITLRPVNREYVPSSASRYGWWVKKCKNKQIPFGSSDFTQEILLLMLRIFFSLS
jgi:hypothetical protein